MPLQFHTPFEALHPAYRKQNITLAQIARLEANLKLLFDSINEKESEENVKNLIADFLKDTYYKGQQHLNTKGRFDLVIHQDKTAASPVGVLIEVKRPSNKAEMMTLQNQNVKALHELLHYFMQERFVNGNKTLKNLIVTNGNEWFIFDAADFERFFFDNPKLVKTYTEWQEKREGVATTDWFYTELAPEWLALMLPNLTCTHFDLQAHAATTRTDENTATAIAFYKILSPPHLLKQAFVNDNNSLNRAFYNELLHILGLEEVKEGGIKRIKRKLEGQRNEGSLLENTINILKTRNKYKAIGNLTDFGETEEEQLFSIALELCITWLNRILFLKLLEGQLVQYHAKDVVKQQDFAFLNTTKIKDFDELNELFFEVLAEDITDRSAAVNTKFGNLPYLNSALFEESAIERQTLIISGLKDRLEMPLFGATVLKNSNGIQRTGSQKTLAYLFAFLDAYDFANDGSAAMRADSKDVINAAVLGLIFEKINGYKDGSFFTPSFITMYMCRETIRKTVIQKFNTEYNWNCQTFDDVFNKIDSISLAEANKTINTLKICDPAVGSGHFLVSALNEVIAIKSELRILIDANGRRIRDYAVTVENDALVIMYKEGNFQELFSYNYNSPESQNVQETLFREKQIIIENCLFGVDLNPKSVMICRLRLWIELLKNMYYKKADTTLPKHLQVRALETLPNIDINIKCGNSLISRFDIKDNYGKLPATTQQKIKFATQKYKDQVMIYKNTTDKALKRQTLETIDELKKTFSQISNPNDSDYRMWKEKEAEVRNTPLLFSKADQDAWKLKTEQLIAEANILKIKYDEKLKTLYKKSFEWRFEFPEVLNENGQFEGFDIIIGNPPYGLFNKKQNQKIGLEVHPSTIDFIKKHYPAADSGMINAAKVFILLGFKLLQQKGYNAMIVPLGILTETSSVKIRKHLFETHSFFKIDAFPERDSVARRVFDEAKMSTTILLFTKEKYNTSFELGVSYKKAIEHSERLTLSYKKIEAFDSELLSIPLTNAAKFNLLLKLFSNKNVVRLATITACLTGEVDITLAKNAITASKKDCALIKGVQIDKYQLKLEQKMISQGDIEFLNLNQFHLVYKGEKLKHSNQERIVLQGLTGVNEKNRIKATLIPAGYYLANSCNYILPINNEKNKISTYFIIALLNSKLLNFVFKTRSTSSNVNGYEIDQLPVLVPESFFIYDNLVQQILAAKQQNHDTAALEAEIDELVYKLYDLTDAEIKIVNE